MEIDTGCDYCGAAETLAHALVECPKARFCWQFFAVELHIGKFSNFLQMFEYLHKVWESEFLESFIMCMGLWSVWSSRNELKWNQVEEGPYPVVTRVRSSQWFPPPVGTFKINFDATLFPSVGHGTVGAVISNCNRGFVSAATSSLQGCSSPAVAEAQALRKQNKTKTFKINFDAALLPSVGHGAVGAVISNCHGGFVSAATSSLQGCSSPAVAEAQALRKVLSWVLSGHPNLTIQVETDCLQVYHAMKSSANDWSEFGVVISECKLLLVQLPSVSLAWIRRQANDIAHVLAKSVPSEACFQIWDDAPNCIAHFFH
ncbi:uncharacterized protein LOC105644336 [Jatropha curcas]|uniref:uncharacterized protein LOC105644336 n=1 Tax=Jatropha curcas TaxID=180498 RepID=UPI0018932DBD|nr:uncharacterized protein LOC105644336 [Jatropha curcas]